MNVKQKKEFYKRNNQNKKQNISNKGSIDYDIYESEKIDLTGKDLEKICEGKVKVISYHELASINSIEELLSPHNAVILLYETKENFGHYTALFIDRNKQLEFFDSYGFAPDQELNYAKYDDTPYLTNLLNKYKGNVIHNITNLQKFARDVNTCGRWTATRIRMKDLTADEFSKLWKTKFYNPDFFISALTFLYTFNNDSS